jgi:solute:Na+ symporter, SSS family
LLAGTLSSIGMFFLVKVDPGMLSVIALSTNAKPLAEDMYRALWSALIGVLVTVGVSLATKPKPDAELVNLVYGLTDIPREGAAPVIQRPIFWAAVVIVVLAALQWIFW